MTNLFLLVIIKTKGVGYKKYISGLSLVVFGLILFFAYLFFAGNAESLFGEFSNGLLLGLSLGIILVEIILIVVIEIKSKRENKK